MGGQCSFIKASGERCRGAATGQHGLCWAHDPVNADRRRRTASKGGRSKANREVADLKAEIKAVIADVRGGGLDRNDAAVLIQAYRALKDFIALERQVKETEDLERRIEALEGDQMKGEVWQRRQLH